MNAARFGNLFPDVANYFPCLFWDAPRQSAMDQIDRTAEIVRALAEPGFGEAARKCGLLLLRPSHNRVCPHGHHMFSHAFDHGLLKIQDFRVGSLPDRPLLLLLEFQAHQEFLVLYRHQRLIQPLRVLDLLRACRPCGVADLR